MDDPDLESRQGNRILFKTPTTSLRPLSSLLFEGPRGTFLVLKRPGHDVDRSYPSRSGVESE